MCVSVSHSVISNSLQCHGLQLCRLLCPWNSPGKNTGVGFHFLLQEIFQTQGLNPGLLHCRQILYRLSHQGSPKILEWVACPLGDLSDPGIEGIGVSCIAGRFFSSWATRKAKENGADFFKVSVCFIYVILKDWFTHSELGLGKASPELTLGGSGPNIERLAVMFMVPSVYAKRPLSSFCSSDRKFPFSYVSVKKQSWFRSMKSVIVGELCRCARVEADI